jgi:hypothetical protein
MKALSVRQPYAWLIIHGHKDIENRTWPTRYRGAFLVHASATLHGTADQREGLRSWVRQRFGVEVPEDDDLERGGIVGEASVVDVVKRSSSPWFTGPVGFVLDKARPFVRLRWGLPRQIQR